jgi:hypothetical protein
VHDVRALRYLLLLLLLLLLNVQHAACCCNLYFNCAAALRHPSGTHYIGTSLAFDSIKTTALHCLKVACAQTVSRLPLQGWDANSAIVEQWYGMGGTPVVFAEHRILVVVEPRLEHLFAGSPANLLLHVLPQNLLGGRTGRGAASRPAAIRRRHVSQYAWQPVVIVHTHQALAA